MRLGNQRGVCALLVRSAAVAMLCGIAPVEAINKCRMPDGTFHYTDAPCPATNPSARRDPEVGSADDSPLDPEAAAIADPLAPRSATAATPEPAVTAPATTDPAAAPPPAVSVAPSHAAGQELRVEPTTRRSLDPLMWLGGIVATIAWAWLVTHAWRAGSRGWSIAMFLLYPLILVYALLRRGRTLAALGAYLAGVVVSYACWTHGVDLMWVEKGALKRGGEGWPERDVRRFGADDRITVLTAVRWRDRFWDKRHIVEWTWVSGDDVVAEFADLLEFDGNPYVFHGWVPAARLGPGAHEVHVHIDGELFQVEPFEVAGS